MLYRMRKKTLGLAIFFAFFPFVSPYPLNTDVQPIFFVLASFCLLFTTRKIEARPALILMPICVSSIIYFQSYDEWQMADFGRILCSIIAFVFFLNFSQSINSRMLFILSAVNSAILAMHFLIPGVFVRIFEPFVRVIKIEEIGIRGASGLAPEPGFAGAVLIGIFATACFRKEFYNDTYKFKSLLAMTVIGVFLTRSGTGTLYLVIFVLLYFFRAKSVLILLASLLAIYLAVTMLDVGRGSSSIISLISNPAGVLLSDISIGSRALNFIIGIVAVFDSPFGSGFDSYERAALGIALEYSLYDHAFGRIGRLSALATYSVLVGLIWWITLAILFIFPARRIGLRCFPFLVLAFIFLSFSFSIAFPLTWVLLGSCWFISLRGSIEDYNRKRDPLRQSS